MEDMDVHHYILDPSALVYGGVGKIKQWIDATNDQYKNYRADDHDHSKKLYSIVFYVPLYTLRELDFLKKVFNPLISANARESIKFIDNQISCVQFDNTEPSSFSDNEDGEEEYDNINDTVANEAIAKYKEEQRRLNQSNDTNDEDYTDFESYNKMKSQQRPSSQSKKQPLPNLVSFILESKDSVGPDWKIASGYRRSTPLLSELPTPINGFSSKGQFNHDNRKKLVGVFGNNIPGTFNMVKSNNNENDDFRFHDENNNDNSHHHQKNNSNEGENEEKAVVPIRLKYLIRSCIQKQYIENRHLPDQFKINWDIICEDATTTIWLKSFGLNVQTLNEVQKDFDTYSGGAKAKVLFDPNSGGFVESVTKSNEGLSKSNKGQSNKKGNNRNRNRNRKKNDKKSKDSENNSNQAKVAQPIRAERTITADSFASRREGELWTP